MGRTERADRRSAQWATLDGAHKDTCRRLNTAAPLARNPALGATRAEAIGEPIRRYCVSATGPYRSGTAPNVAGARSVSGIAPHPCPRGERSRRSVPVRAPGGGYHGRPSPDGPDVPGVLGTSGDPLTEGTGMYDWCA